LNNKEDILNTLNYYGSKKEPFFFVIDYNLDKYDIQPLNTLHKDIHYLLENTAYKKHNAVLKKQKVSYGQYEKRFNKIQEHIRKGNSYLLNLTAKTKINTDLSLKQIYDIANAKYKLYYKNKFVCFSPEQFVKISNDTIFTYPMKGTIDANTPNAKDIILNNPKELAEHTMVVDLLRNDLSMVAKNVKVDKFRYIQKINAGSKKLYQVSSKISASLKPTWHNEIGNIITTLLPAGSITGTPKKSTVKILKEIEEYRREYFTGVFGVYDGKSLNSAVMIRFIQKDNGVLWYKSGGGITCDSRCRSEYDELYDKIYIP
jgi:para-aminobenzoate synthetase component 1